MKAFLYSLLALCALAALVYVVFEAGRAQGYNEVICLPAWDEPVRRDA